MNVSSVASRVTSAAKTSLVVVSVVAVPAVFAQASPEELAANGLKVARLVPSATSLSVEAGKTVPLTIQALDSAGKPIDVLMFKSGPRGALSVTDTAVTGLKAGSYNVVATVFTGRSAATGPAPLSVTIPVKVTWPALSRVEITPEPGKLFAGVTLAHSARATHADGSIRPQPTVRWTSSNTDIATVDRFGNVTALRPGTAVISATVDGVKGDLRYTIGPSPVAALEVQVSQTDVRTGDVVHVKAVAKDRAGAELRDAPITWTFTYTPDDSIRGQGAAGDIRDGMFVAEFAGVYNVMAVSGQATARKSIDVRPREVMKSVKVLGRGTVTNVNTSDFWPFTGKDGRDYALVGTWGGDGWTYVFDITDQTNIRKTDSIQVDARVVNDVTVSPDARYGVITREGASNRVNGVVILDLSTPAHPTIASRFDQQLTGGVHNAFATNDYLYAISGGDKYVIIDVRDLTQPKYAGEYNHPNSRIHDVWVNDGIAYSSEWGTGVVAVDVGNGTYGGTPQKPVLIGTFPTTSGASHEIFPYFQKSTGKVYLFLGDEVMSRKGKVWEGTDYMATLGQAGGVPQTSGGYTAIVDFTDPKHPKQIARYEQPEFGSHDIIVQDDVLYQAYYDGGLRVVDVSGELMGNLARQQREIAVWKPYDPQGRTANAPFVMNAMPWKGNVLFTDFNTGLWAVKLEPRNPVVP
ncbi:MAG TPA: Ig-like domain-containing protein [Gemmatimonadaceae bacterium]|nr:Ig-like domain-containing protein [Gemmatimonadaceae bacterium]